MRNFNCMICFFLVVKVYMNIVENCKVQKYMKKVTEDFLKALNCFLKVLCFGVGSFFSLSYNICCVSQTFLLP